ncbi:MAG: hypothetical protein KYX69_22500 [Sphingomonas sp.]|uniref:hypothetical protein n=1 Tax=Sphingomonas sp. TaxID=28214 RepID=UPI0026325E04|nr:hypothetical protein [Sphingomonas sp.]MDK2770476.1 hypothetical protein [Sphingomonas sp.]
MAKIVNFQLGRADYLAHAHLACLLAARRADTGAVAIVEAIEQRLRTGRPLAADAWIAAQEALTGRTIARRKPGPRTREQN